MSGRNQLNLEQLSVWLQNPTISPDVTHRSNNHQRSVSDLCCTITKSGEIFKYQADIYLQHPGSLWHLLAQPELVAVVLVAHNLRHVALECTALGGPVGDFSLHRTLGDLSLHRDLGDHGLLLGVRGVDRGCGAGGGHGGPLSPLGPGGGSSAPAPGDQGRPVTNTGRGSERRNRSV